MEEEKNDGIHVLMIEDNEDIREPMAMLISKIGCKVVAVETAEEGLKFLDENWKWVDFVITDLDLPGLSGDAIIERTAELARAQCELPRQVPIVVCSARYDFKPNANVAVVLKKYDAHTQFEKWLAGEPLE